MLDHQEYAKFEEARAQGAFDQCLDCCPIWYATVLRLEGWNAKAAELGNAPSIPYGWKAVPTTPMEQMCAAFAKSYSEMVAQAPALPPSPTPDKLTKHQWQVAFTSGFRTAADWAERDDLHADIGSPAFCSDMQLKMARAFPLTPEPTQPAAQHVGDSDFEQWYSDYTISPGGCSVKQLMRDAYAAGMGDSSRDVVQASETTTQAAPPQAAPVYSAAFVIASLEHALQTAKNGLEWYVDEFPQAASGCDDEAFELIDHALFLATQPVLSTIPSEPVQFLPAGAVGNRYIRIWFVTGYPRNGYPYEEMAADAAQRFGHERDVIYSINFREARR